MTILKNGIESALWSIAIPGLGQLLNKKYFKGIILIALEFLIRLFVLMIVSKNNR